MIDNLRKEERTNIIPLRVFANWIERFAKFALNKAIYQDDINQHGILYKFWGKLQAILYKPVYAWGTYYVWDEESLQKFLKDIKEDKSWDFTFQDNIEKEDV
jgi:hypothetical protein